MPLSVFKDLKSIAIDWLALKKEKTINTIENLNLLTHQLHSFYSSTVLLVIFF